MANKLEYQNTMVELDCYSRNYYSIPSSVIFDPDGVMNEKRISVFSFFSMFKAANDNLFFSVNSIVKWLGRKPNKHKNAINDKIHQNMDGLIYYGHLSMIDDCGNDSYCSQALVNMKSIRQECDIERFAIIYFDEYEKIMSYKFSNNKDVYLSNDSVLLVFAYLRSKIAKRRNELLPEEINLDNKNDLVYDIQKRKLKSPDVYNCFLMDIARELKLSDRVVSLSVSVLNELGLIYSVEMPRTRQDDSKWKTNHTLFCNAYKREGGYLLDSGEQYYLTEIENKKKKLNGIFRQRK